MKFDQFLLLTGHEKQEALLHQGILIGKRTEESVLIFLFQMPRFYVEVFCQVASKSVREYRMFDGTGPLYPYIQNISIDQLLSEEGDSI